MEGEVEVVVLIVLSDCKGLSDLGRLAYIIEMIKHSRCDLYGSKSDMISKVYFGYTIAKAKVCTEDRTCHLMA